MLIILNKNKHCLFYINNAYLLYFRATATNRLTSLLKLICLYAIIIKRWDINGIRFGMKP